MDAEQEKPGAGPEQNQYENLDRFIQGEYLPGPHGASDDAQPGGAGVGGKEVAALLQMVFATVARRRGAHWMLSTDEADNLGEATDACLKKWFGEFDIGPEGALIMVAGLTVMPRVMVDQQLAEQAAKQRQQQEQYDTAPPPPPPKPTVKPKAAAPRKPKRPAARKPKVSGGTHGDK